jgi:hypothetical protein
MVGLVYQIKTARQQESSKSSYGTGLVLDRCGILMTNYHVISQAVMEPKLNQLFLVRGTENLPLEILAVSSAHDLAVVRAPVRFERALTWAPQMPRVGDATYSIGIPLDLNLSIVRGVFNDVIPEGPYGRVHLSTPINAGMSGGPTVDVAAQLIGVNVSRAVGAQNISFAVPQNFARKLWTSLGPRPCEAPAISAEGANQAIGRELDSVQKRLTEDLFKTQREKPDHRFGAWAVLPVPDYIDCWSRKEEDEKKRHATVRENCDMKESLYIDEGLDSGALSAERIIIERHRLNGLQFLRLVNRHIAQNSLLGDGGFAFAGKSGGRRPFGLSSCGERNVTSQSGAPIRVGLCVREMVRWPGFFDASVQLVTDVRHDQVAVQRLTFRGFRRDSIERVVSFATEGFRRPPASESRGP